MTAARLTFDSPAPATDWNWRHDLASLDAAIAHVASGDVWDWRSELAALDADLDQLAGRLGL